MTSNDTAAHYTVTYSDIDPGQTLTVKWSVVPTGQTANYSLAANPDGSLDFNWALVDVGTYDMSVRVSDGIDNSTCNIIGIVKSNLPPVVGAVSGKTPVNGLDTAANYSAPISDPDITQTLTIKWSVVPHGNAPNYIHPAKGDGSLDIDWAPVPVGKYDVNVQANDGFVSVEGTMLVVDRVNTDPVVGSVTGPSPVYCTDTASKYSAPFSDADTSQTLTILWSVRSHGTPASFTIPANGDGLLTYDWSSAAIGQYDVNLRVDDGYTQVTGTLMVVDKNNTAPTVGAVSGPNSVTDKDISNYSLVPAASDCDTFQTLTYEYSIVPLGNAANYNIPSGDGTLTVDWSTYGVGQYTMSARVSDGIAQVFATSLNVIVTLAPCVGNAHTFYGTINPSPYSVHAMSVIPRTDIAFIDSGTPGIKGLGVVQIGPSTLGAFNANTTGSSNVLFKYFLGKKTSSMRIDTDPVSGRILTPTFDNPSSLKIIDSSIIIGNSIIGTVDTGSPQVTWVALDFEANGNFWAVQRLSSPSVSFRLVHYTYLPDAPYYAFDATGTTDITAQVGTNSDIFNIAINQKSEVLYLLEAGAAGRGVLHSYKLTSGSPAAYQTSVNNLFSQTLDYQSVAALGTAAFGDIDIDHVDSNDQRCRMLVYGRLAERVERTHKA